MSEGFHPYPASGGSFDEPTRGGGDDSLLFPVIIRDRCLLSDEGTSECDLCADVCPTDAISFPDEFPVVDRSSCLGCGLCSKVCPSETISILTGGLTVLRNRVSAIAEEFGPVYLTCRETDALGYSNAIISVPCLGMLPAEFWFSCLAEGEDIGVFLPDGVCDECLCRRGEDELMDAIADAEAWSGRSVGLAMDRDDLDFAIITSSTDVLDRRGLLTAVPDLLSNATRKVRVADSLSPYPQRAANARKVMEAARRAKQERDERFAEAHETGVLRTKARVMTERRKLVADALTQSPELATSTVLLVSETDHDLCTMCKKCISECPFSARRIRDIRLFTDQRYCVGCGRCADMCPEGAIRIVDVDASALIEEGRSENR